MAASTSPVESSAALAKRSSFRKCQTGRYCGATLSCCANVSRNQYQLGLNASMVASCLLNIRVFGESNSFSLFQMFWPARTSQEGTLPSLSINVSVKSHGYTHPSFGCCLVPSVHSNQMSFFHFYFSYFNVSLTRSDISRTTRKHFPVTG